MGLTPVASKQDVEDKTMAVVAKFIDGDEGALKTLANNQGDYHISLAGMYGFYYLKVAQQEQEFEQALALMLVAKKAINNPRLDMQIAQTQQKLGKISDAKHTLTQLLATKPDYQAAKDLLATL